ncbi:MAG TPA: bifunctional methylenetetrahydrofolate dehydrogenase/methenyltetrahydrofolate cyclohydrolase FolD [bacterium]
MAVILDGKSLAKQIRDKLKEETLELKDKGIKPGLTVLLIGNNPASEIYVRNKKKAAEEAGIVSNVYTLEKDVSEEKVVDLINELNRYPAVHGILIQLPLPQHLSEEKLIRLIDPVKDVDGFHPESLGLLFKGAPRFEPCTPLGIMRILSHYNIKIGGKDAVIVGRSNIVGKPVAIMLMKKDATITICHTKTQNLPEKVSNADILIVAAGRAGAVKGAWIKEGAVVIDVGINRLADGKLVGDVEFETAEKRAGYITPVPGGVGPMTIAMLLSNTVRAARLQQGLMS